MSKWCTVVLGLGLALASVAPTAAAVTPALIFTDNAVLQRDRRVPFWGWAAAGETVTVAFAGQRKSASADANGKWLVWLDALSANRTGADLTIGGASSSRTLHNVVVGDVWLCAGGSNMQATMSTNNVVNWAAERAAANYPQLRCVTLASNHAAVPLEQDLRGSYAWQACTPNTVTGWSATAYFFGRELARNTTVPIGLITATYGGAWIASFVAPAGWRLVPALRNYANMADENDPSTSVGQHTWTAFCNRLEAWLPRARVAVNAGRYPTQMPTPPGPFNDAGQQQTLYNAMIYPLLPYALRGFVWWQGEADVPDGLLYTQKLTALVGGWRAVFGQGDLPFYFMQLANTDEPVADPSQPAGDEHGSPATREAQRQALGLANTGMAVAVDIGGAKGVLPRDRQDAGRRLALWALARDYGAAVVPSGPLLRSVTYEAGRLRLAFDYADGGLMVGHHDWTQPDAPTTEVAGEALHWFAVAGTDRHWHWARAALDGQTVVVDSADVPVPVAVRYAYVNNPGVVNFYNRAGLPAAPFDAVASNPPAAPRRAAGLVTRGGQALVSLGQALVARLGRLGGRR